MDERDEALIVSTPDTLSGAFRIAGTRLPAALILGCLAQGMEEKDILASYPSLPDGSVRAALAFAARLLEDADRWVPREAVQAGREPGSAGRGLSPGL